MLPYQENGKKLEKLLERLFEENDGLTSEGILVVQELGGPRPRGSCCTYNYNNY